MLAEGQSRERAAAARLSGAGGDSMTTPGSGVEKQPSRRAHNPETAGATPATAPPVAYLTTTEAAAYLRVSPNTLRGWRVSGKGPAYRDHGRVVYAQLDLDKWSEGRTRLSTSDAPTEVSTPTT